MRSGSSFAVLVPWSEVDPTIWDPHALEATDRRAPRLGDLVSAHKPRRRRGGDPHLGPWAPLEYRDIPPGPGATFALERSDAEQGGAHASVPGRTLLFGTMRAYLGNVVVTPDPTWIDAPAGTTFAVKSEFLVVEPVDGLVWWWAALLRSPAFLRILPPGGGGTRPRLDADALLRLRVEVPPLAERRAVDERLAGLAERAWRLQGEHRRTLDDAGL